MAVEWRNNGDPVDGEYIADVDAEDGSQVQTFKGATFKEVADKLLHAQFNGTRRINELKVAVTPDPKKPRRATEPRTLTADERFQAARDLNDPDALPEAIERVVEAKFGRPLSEVAQRLQKLDDQEAIAEITAETTKFVQATPDWYPTPENKAALWNYMDTQNMEFTQKNFGIAFDHLMGNGLLTRKPAEVPVAPEPGAAEPIAPTQMSRPRGSFSATGVRSQDVSATPASKTKPKYTRQEIESMPRDIYASKLTSEPGFEAAVNQALG